MKELSTESQRVVLSSLLRDTYLFQKVNKLINDDFFSVDYYQEIYYQAKYHFERYGNVPAMDVLISDLIERSDFQASEINDLKSTIYQLFEVNSEDSQEYIYNKIISFIKARSIQRVLANNLNRLNDPEDEGVLEDISAQLIECNNIIEDKETDDGVLRMSDPDNLEKYRKMAVGDGECSTGIPSFIKSINKSLTFGGYKYGDLVAVVSPPGTCKTFFMINEAYNAAQHGFNVIHLFIGDMNEYDGWVRYMALMKDVDQNELVDYTVEQQKNFTRNVALSSETSSRIYMKSYPQGEKTVDELLYDVRKIQKSLNVHFDMILVDYPDNLIADDERSYESAGSIYGKLSAFGYKNRSAMIVGSQPKIGYYSYEIIPLEAASESSKKQHHIDMMITIGMYARDLNILTGFIAKNRRGDCGRVFRLKTEFSKSRMSEISELDYREAVNNYNSSGNKK